MMKQLSVLKWGLGLMLFLNIVLTAFLIMGRPKHRSPHAGGDRLLLEKGIQAIGLNEEQATFFRASAKAHHDSISQILKTQQPVLEAYFNTIENNNQALKDSLFLTFQTLESKKLQVTYQHFKALKEQLNPNQIPDFKHFISRVQENFFLEQKNNRKKAKDSKH